MKKLLLAVALCCAWMPAYAQRAPGYQDSSGQWQGAIGVFSANPATVVTGQVKIATTGVAVQLPSITGVNGFVVRVKSTNTGVGGLDCAGPSGVTTVSDGTGNGACEPPGSAWSFGVSSAGAIWVNGAAGDIFFIYGN